MIRLLRSLLPAIAICIIAMLQAGCRENTLISSKLSPAKDSAGVHSYNGIVCNTHTYFDNDVITSTNEGLPIYQGVGAMTDPFFGALTGATYFQVIPFEPALDYTSIIVDSAVLVLPYSGFTNGDTTSTTATQTYQVFYLTDTLGYSTNYYATSVKPIDLSNPLSDPATVNVHSLRDSSILTTGINEPGLRIKMNAKFMSRLNTAIANMVNSGTQTTAGFLANFNGLCVRSADTREAATAMPYFQLDGSGDFYSRAGVIVYYHTASGDTTSTSYFFSTDACAHFNSISRSYSRYPLNALIHSAQTNDSVIALQNQPGAAMDIILSGIKGIPAGVVINKAELQLSILPGYGSSSFLLPEKLYPLGVYTGTYPSAAYPAGTLYSVYDQYPLTSTSPLVILDGYIHSFTYNNGTTAIQKFTIDIPREIIAAIAAKSDTVHLHINGTTDFYGAFNLVAGGGNYPDSLYRAKLNVVYSTLNN